MKFLAVAFVLQQTEWKLNLGINRDDKEPMLINARKHLVTLTSCLLAVCSLALWGCGGTRPAISDAGNAAEAFTEPQSNLTTGTVIPPLPQTLYRIGMLDELEIRVRYHDRLNNIVKVRPDGRITLEDLGDLLVAGMTPPSLDSLITDLYSGLIHEPEVTVFVRGFAELSLYVVGEVRDPGVVVIKPKMTVLQALAAAKGPIRTAKMSSVIMLRRDATGELRATRLDLAGSAIKNAAYQDLYVQPEDIIFVPKTFIASVNNFLTQVYDGLFPPVDVYLRALREYNRNNP
jgi:protein involved in polysaccharide export with SLBB domain